LKADSCLSEARPVSRGRGGNIEAPAVELLRELVALQRQILAALERQQRPDANSKHVWILPALAVAVADRAFSAREVMQHAALADGELRAALDGAGLSNGRKLGKFLKGVEGQTIAGIRLERIGIDRDGVIWRVWRV
jgi:hypothetical protein